jgi:hypothetical protein
MQPISEMAYAAGRIGVASVAEMGVEPITTTNVSLTRCSTTDDKATERRIFGGEGA